MPDLLRAGTQWLLRGYGDDDRIVYGTGDVVPQQHICTRAHELLQRDDIAYLHVRSAKYNCYQARIERGELEPVMQRGIVQCMGGGDGNRARHVRHAVMNDAVHLIGGVGMGGGVRGLETAALIDGNIDKHGALFHARQHFTADELGRGCAGDEHCADHNVG